MYVLYVHVCGVAQCTHAMAARIMKLVSEGKVGGYFISRCALLRRVPWTLDSLHQGTSGERELEVLFVCVCEYVICMLRLVLVCLVVSHR